MKIALASARIVDRDINYRAPLKTLHAHTHVTILCYNKGNQAKEQKRWETEGFLTKIFDLQS